MKNTKDMEKVKEKVLSEYEKGNVVVSSIEGLQAMPLNEFIKQPVEGMLYDLNRGELTVLAFIEDPKWVNDYAVCKVIRALKHEQKPIEERLYTREEVETLVRYTISQWSSLNEMQKSDHKNLVNNWIKEDYKDWIKENFK